MNGRSKLERGSVERKKKRSCPQHLAPQSEPVWRMAEKSELVLEVVSFVAVDVSPADAMGAVAGE